MRVTLPENLDLSKPEDALKAFEYGLAEEINCWMDDVCEPLDFLCEKVINGEVDYSKGTDSPEYKDTVTRFTKEFYSETEDYEEPVSIGLNFIYSVASGNSEEISIHFPYIVEEPESWSGLTLDAISEMFKGDYVKVAKASLSALTLLV